MTGHTSISFVVDGREIAFKMTYDAACQTDNDMLHELQTHGTCEPEVIHAMRKIIRPGDFVIDGGANIGFFTMTMADLVGRDGRVMAFEPGQNNLWKLQENVRINRKLNVEIVGQPLWSEVTDVELHMCDHGGRNALAKNDLSRGVHKTKSTTIDAECYDRAARLIKLDIEGSEEAALRGAERQLECFACPFIIAEMNEEALHLLGSSQSKLREFMQEWGYQAFLLRPDGELPCYVPRTTKIIPRFLNTNLLFSTVEMVGAVWNEVRL